MKVQYMRAHIADDGTIHIAADRATMKQQLASVDLDRARTLTKTSYFWVSSGVQHLRGKGEGMGKDWARTLTSTWYFWVSREGQSMLGEGMAWMVQGEKTGRL